MEFERHGDTLTLRLRRDFNLTAVRHLTYHLEDAKRVRVDLRGARIVDTEGVMALFRLMKKGVTVRVLEPPPLFFEVLEVLELETAFDLEQLVERPRPS